MRRSSRFSHFIIQLLMYAFFLPAQMAAHAASNPAYTNNYPANAHVMRRLNSQDRAAAIAEAARIDAAAREAYAQSEAASPKPSASGGEKAARLPSSSRETVAASRPQSMTEVLFNHGASFMGVPGLAPRQGVDGSLDEGLGFHQDGTARKAGGGFSGPSAKGQRARSYMQSGLPYGNGMNGYPGLYGELHYDLWGRDDPTRGGRVTDSSGYSRNFGQSELLDRGLNWGAGLVNSMGEAAISGLVDEGRARLNFHMDKDGCFGGEGDALLPFHDGKYTTIYTQLGARSMHDSSDTRWIGNFGLGQRWFPFAEGGDVKSANYDAGKLMVGYNAFFDYDLSRDHQRGGVGAELQYDWLRLASNYYVPISGWKGSKDFDSRFVKERPAAGWDARAKAYLPFYRNVALTGAYSQWFGDHVGVFGASNLEKDPKVWSYGVEYTPVPLVSGFINQRSTERGRTDTEFGLNFTYHFQMPWEDQVKHSKVAELRTVGGSRHEFVDRENKIILEYRAKSDYYIEYVGPGSNRNEFVFRVKKAFGGYAAGQTVRVTASNVTLAEAPVAERSFFARAGDAIADFFSVSTAHAADFTQTYVTDSQGQFVVKVKSSWAGSLSLHELVLNTNHKAQTFTFHIDANETYTLGGSGGTPITMVQHAPTNVTVVLENNGVALPGKSVTFTAHPVFANLPSAAQTTDSSGNIILTGLVGTVVGTHTVLATVDSQTVNLEITVTPAVYTLNMTPPALTQHVPQSATFTLLANGTPLPSASLTFDGPANTAFTNLPVPAQTTNPSGQFPVSNLIGTVAGAQTITAIVDGQTVTVNVTVTPATYTLEASPPTLTQHLAQNVTVTLENNGVALPGKSVTFTAHPAFANLPSAAQTTDSSGNIVLAGLVGAVVGGHTVLATVDGQTVSLDITVTPATYTLEMTPPALTQHVPQSVTFTLKNNGAALPGASTTFIANSNFTNLPMPAQTTDPSGQILVNNLIGTIAGAQTISATVDGMTVSVNITVMPPTISFTPAGVTGGTGSFTSHTTATFAANLAVNGAPSSGQAVTWRIVSADNSANLAVASGHQDKATGLAWGSSATTSSGIELTGTDTSSTDSSGNASIQLTDIMGERTVTVQAEVIISGTPYTATQNVTFGDGPLSRFRMPSSSGAAKWSDAYAICNGAPYSGSFVWASGTYVGGPNMPTRAELLSVSGAGTRPGAYMAVGWPGVAHWTGEADSTSAAFIMSLNSGSATSAHVNNGYYPICRR